MTAGVIFLQKPIDKQKKRAIIKLRSKKVKVKFDKL